MCVGARVIIAIYYGLRDILIACGAPRTDGSGVRERIFVALCVQGSFIISARLNTEKYIPTQDRES